MTPEIRDHLMDIVLCDVRDHKTLARVRALLDGRPVIWPDDLRAALDGPTATDQKGGRVG
jgi:hypothetical protein